MRRQGQRLVDRIIARRHNQTTPIGRLIHRHERIKVVCKAVTDCAIIADIGDVQCVTLEQMGYIFDCDIIDPQHRTRRAGDVDAEMAKGGLCAPHHIDPIPKPRTHDRGNFIDFAIICQRHGRADLGHLGYVIPVCIARPCGNTHRRQTTRHQFDPRFDQQIRFRHQLGLTRESNFLDGIVLDQFQTAAEILIDGHIGGISDHIIRVIRRCPISAGPII